MGEIEELEAHIKSWDGINKYIVKDAKARIIELNKLKVDKPKVAKDFKFYKDKTMVELKYIAKSKGLSYSNIKEDDSIKKIMEA